MPKKNRCVSQYVTPSRARSKASENCFFSIRRNSAPDRAATVPASRARKPGHSFNIHRKIGPITFTRRFESRTVRLELTSSRARLVIIAGYEYRRPKGEPPETVRFRGVQRVRAEGIEPSTYGLRVHCSAN